MCHLFNSHPSLAFDESEMIDIEETREEKTLRNWINSLGVKPQVHHLFSDLSDGIALAQLFEQVRNTLHDALLFIVTCVEKRCLCDILQEVYYHNLCVLFIYLFKHILRN